MADLAVKEIARTASIQVSEASASVKKAAKEPAGALNDPSGTRKDLPPKELEKVASEIQMQLKRLNTDLRFEVGNGAGEVVVKIVDHDTGQVIRQIPSEELLAIRQRMQDLIGVLCKTKT